MNNQNILWFYMYFFLNDFNLKFINLFKITEEWSAFKFQPYHDHTYGLLEVSNSTTLKWTYIYSNGSVIDIFSLLKVIKFNKFWIKFHLRKFFFAFYNTRTTTVLSKESMMFVSS